MGKEVEPWFFVTLDSRIENRKYKVNHETINKIWKILKKEKISFEILEKEEN